MATIKDGRIFFDKTDFGGVTILGMDIKVPYQELFKWAFRRHDLQYQFHNSEDEGTRDRIDKDLLNDMINICLNKKKDYLIPYCYLVYSIVRAGGWTFFKKEKWNVK
jgi:hypothetical protein